MDPGVLARKQLPELKTIAADLRMRGYQRLKKAELIDAIVRAADGGSSSAAASAGGQLDLGTSGSAAGNGSTGNGAPAEAVIRPRTRTRTRERTAEQREIEARGEQSGNGGTDTGETGGSPAPAATAAERAVEPQAAQVQPARVQPAGESAERAPDVRSADVRSADGGQPNGGSPREGGVAATGGASQTGGSVQTGGSSQNSGSAQTGGSSQGGSAQTSGQQQSSSQQREDESGGRRRRSRRERRRGKSSGSSHTTTSQTQGRPRDDDPNAEPGEVRSGVLDILPEGYGFLRTSGYLPGDRDVYVSQGQVRKHGLRRGDVIEGPIRQQRHNEKVPALHMVSMVNGAEADQQGPPPHRPDFKDMTPLFPDDRLHLEIPEGPISMRIVDLMAPIGKGQRGLIVSPPKAGKTTILKELGQAIAFNNPECHLMVVLVDERPEEVTDMKRSIPGEVIASTFDRPADDHTQIAELAMERAKRLVEAGRDVVVLLDSITRLARAYNLAAPASGRIMSGGVDSTALYPPKRFFGAARNIEDGGSLTIIASALIETGSKMDEVIFEEFKGTGNMELRLDRKLEQKRIFPAIDIEASGTRKEELLLDKEELTIIWKLRRVLHALDSGASLELLIDKIRSTRSNNQFLVQIQKSNLQS
ncbi:MAG: transcription termination factor Rho [Actinomycetota bacterium]|nr:transcription termination factor Rho [Actinomycetota bacterium]